MYIDTTLIAKIILDFHQLNWGKQLIFRLHASLETWNSPFLEKLLKFFHTF